MTAVAKVAGRQVALKGERSSLRDAQAPIEVEV